MATVKSILAQLKKKGTEQTRKTFVRHGVQPEEMYGVRVADLKVIAKSIKGEQSLACRLYETGNVDAMYLAGIVADGRSMTKSQLDSWVRAAKKFSWISEYTVPWVASESPHGRALALKWMKSKSEHIAAAGWSTYAGLLAILPDDDLDLTEIGGLLDTIQARIHTEKNRVRYTMNGFVIAVGAYVKPLLKRAKSIAKKIGVVEVDMGGTACKVPLATTYIEKIESMGRVGRKRKTIRC